MPADDFICVVALDLLGADVPASHLAVDVEHIDRIVADAGEQHPDVLLGFAQRAFGLLALGHVQADTEHADGLIFSCRITSPTLSSWRTLRLPRATVLMTEIPA